MCQIKFCCNINDQFRSGWWERILSDHNLLMMPARLRLKKYKKKTTTSTGTRYNLNAPKTNKVNTAFYFILSNRFQSLQYLLENDNAKNWYTINGSMSNKSGETHLRKSLTGERLNVSEFLKIPWGNWKERNWKEKKAGLNGSRARTVNAKTRE